ncbi:DUF4198 domain-containing protein [Psychroflexus tropicus]|uniref:DUF4198 domain-containing protein n=1 Tax=Psychroflexus tropicus TaxID=197345 RepID=UPI0009FBBB69|nr:DUF4198 domain-containing protein [Psychroflexus tropicus]
MRLANKTLSLQTLKPLLFLLAVILLCSHDLYLKMDTYILQPNQKATLSLYNGTFEKSENTISRDRILDASVVALGQRAAIQPDQWKDQDSTITHFNFTAEDPGTYLAGVSTKARNIKLTSDKFNSYLKHDGVLDMLEQRTQNGELNQDAVESYQKHVKAIYQVGGVKTEDWKTVLGYPIEFVPLANPYQKYSGDTLAVKLLLDGKPLPNQLVYANSIQSAHSHGTKEHSHDQGAKEHSHPHESDSDEEHTHTSGQELRTDEEGIVFVDLPEDGIYYLRTIHMVKVMDDSDLTHQSKWATLTFEVSHKHDESTHTHDDTDHEGSLPSWVFIIGSLFFIGLLYLIFRKKK